MEPLQGHYSSRQTGNSLRLGNRAFLVRRNPELDEFRYPAHGHESGLVWRPGDGFTRDEAKPDFVFHMTGKHKRRLPRTLPGMKSLPVQNGSAISLSGDDSSQYKYRRIDLYSEFQSVKLLHRRTKQEVWPTYEDFFDSTLPTRTVQPVLVDDAYLAPLFSPFKVSPAETKYATSVTSRGNVQLKREFLDFQNFGRCIEPEVRSEITPALMRMRAFRTSSPLEESGSEQSADLEEYSEYSLAPELEDGEELEVSEEGGSSEMDTDASMWDAEGNHLYPSDIQQLKMERMRTDEEEWDEGGDGYLWD